MKTYLEAKNKTFHLVTIKIQKAGGHKRLSPGVQVFLDPAAAEK